MSFQRETAAFDHLLATAVMLSLWNGPGLESVVPIALAFDPDEIETKHFQKCHPENMLILCFAQLTLPQYDKSTKRGCYHD